jgi:hypothetical protein
MELLPEAIANKLPKLYEQAWLGEDAVIFTRFFDPSRNWAWYVTEYDGKDTFFGFIISNDTRMGYFKLKELIDYRGISGAVIKRDIDFEPLTIKELKSKIY